MKKQALASLLLLTAIKPVSACAYLADPNKSFSEMMTDATFYSGTYFLLSSALILANFVVFYLRKQRDYLILFFLIPVIIVWILLSIFGVLLEECSFLINALKWGSIIFLPFLVIQMALWIGKIGLHLPSNRLKLPSIKL